MTDAKERYISSDWFYDCNLFLHRIEVSSSNEIIPAKIIIQADFLANKLEIFGSRGYIKTDSPEPMEQEQSIALSICEIVRPGGHEGRTRMFFLHSTAKVVVTVDSNCVLYQLGDEHGGFYLNSDPEPLSLIKAGISLAKQTGEDYAGKVGEIVLWSSRDAGQQITHRLVRKLDCIDFLILPGSSPDGLIKTGKVLTALYPDWSLQVQDSELRTIWTNKKTPPAKPRTPHKTANAARRGVLQALPGAFILA